MEEKFIRRSFHFLCLGILLVVFAEATHIPAYPKMLEHFHLGAGYAVYMQLGFALGLTGFQPLMGWLSDSFGQKIVVLFGAGFLAVGSILVAAAPAFWVLVVGLFLKGFSGAAVIPAGVSFVGRYFTQQQRGKTMGIYGFYTVIGGLAGPILSGILIDRFGWNSIFFLCSFFGVISFLLFALGVPNVKGQKSKSFDFLGVIFVFLLLGGLLTVPTFINNYGISSWMWVPALVVSILSFLLLLAVEKKQKKPLLDIKYAKTRTFWGPSIIAVIMYMSFSSVMYVLTFFVQSVQGKSSTVVGLLQFPLFLTMAVANIISGRLMGKYSPRRLIGIAIALLVAGVGMLSMARTATSFIYLFISMSLIGSAIGTVGPVVKSVIVSKASPTRLGVISFTYITIENVASRVGASFALVAFALFSAGGNASSALSTTALLLTIFTAVSFLFLMFIPKKNEENGEEMVEVIDLNQESESTTIG
ncbi:MFS transporter [Bacillus salipaludis]|uniref:MFS transporter n=1 Tax=Bacillus salipaludis TaxID=2547811 RepID=A0AA90R886_9BACI|nr:MFS transporter [Bacillus salipaludis]MDQ6600461.1 MFS transporter [Bacillus salipaludis]